MSANRRRSLDRFGERALKRLYELAEDPTTQEKNRIDIYKWLAEMAIGKPSARREQEDGDADEPAAYAAVKFEGVLDEWAG